MELKIDFHVHSNRSDDGLSSLEAIIKRAEKAGLDGVALCDHNHVFSDQDRLKPLKTSVLVIPGCEFSTASGHMTGLFFDLDDLPSEEERRAAGTDLAACAALVHRYGGLCVLAHPFHSTRRAEGDLNGFAEVDGVEVYNARADFKRENANALAKQACAALSKIAITSTDAHIAREVGRAYTLVEAEEKSLPAIYAALKAGKTTSYPRRAVYLYKGISQFKLKWKLRQYTRLPKAAAYVGYCMLKDWKRR